MVQLSNLTCGNLTTSVKNNLSSKFTFHLCTVADPRGAEGAMAPPPGPVKIGHKKMAAKGDRIDFMFLGPSPLPGRWIRLLVYMT